MGSGSSRGLYGVANPAIGIHKVFIGSCSFFILYTFVLLEMGFLLRSGYSFSIILYRCLEWRSIG